MHFPYDSFDKLWKVFGRTYIPIYDEARAAAVEQVLGADVDDAAMWKRALAEDLADVKRSPKDPFLWFNVGTDYVNLGDYEAASKAYDTARRLKLPWRMLWYQFGPFKAYYEVGRHQEVINLADATIKTAVNDEELFYWKGLAQQALGDPESAKASLAQAVKLRPTYQEAVDALGQLSAMSDAGRNQVSDRNLVSSTRRHIARNVLIVAASFGLAAVAGLFRNAVIAATFGIGSQLDAYYAAFKLPDLLFTVVAGGALATAFIPIFADYVAVDDRRGAWRLTAAVLNWVVILVTLLAALAALFAPVAGPHGHRARLQPGRAGRDRKRHADRAAVDDPLRHVRSAGQRAQWAEALPAARAGARGLPALHRGRRAVPRPDHGRARAGGGRGRRRVHAPADQGPRADQVRLWVVADPAARRTETCGGSRCSMGPRVLDLAMFHLTLLATTNLASRLGAGSVSALQWGWDAMQLPETIIGTAFGLVAFPTLAELAAEGNRDGLRRTLGESLRTVLALAVPAAAGLILLGRPLIAILYQRGSFDAAATDAVYSTLRMYALGLAAQCSLELAARAYFAQKDTITPLLLATASAAGNILLGVILMRPMGADGLALANSIAVTLEVLALLFILGRRLNGVEGRQNGVLLVRVVAATVVMSVAVLGVLALGEQAGLGQLPMLAFAAIAGVLAYLAAVAVLRVRELSRFAEAVVGRS